MFKLGIIVLFIAILLGGCAGRLTLEELENQAVHSGDWTLVNRRLEREKEEKALAEAAAACRTRNRTLVCQWYGCGCMSRDDLNSIFGNY